MEWTCRCGEFAAEVETKGGFRAVCYCQSCRDFAARTEATDALDAGGGSDLTQVAPRNVRFLKGGAEKLAWLKLTPKGPVRWYTTCCNTPVASTLGSPALPFVTLQTHRFADPEAVGPVAARVFPEAATGPVPGGGGGMAALYLRFAGLVLKAKLTGGGKPNPFFGPDGKPVVEGGLVAD